MEIQSPIIWHTNQKNIKTTIRVVILPKFVKINNFCIDKYFKNCVGMQLAYLKNQKQLLIKLVTKGYYKLQNQNYSNFKFLSAKNFIQTHKFITDKYEYLNYTYRWDEENKYLIVNNVYTKRNIYFIKDYFNIVKDLKQRCFKCGGLGWYFDTGMISNNEYARQKGITPKVDTDRVTYNKNIITLLERPMLKCNVCDGSGRRFNKK